MGTAGVLLGLCCVALFGCRHSQRKAGTTAASGVAAASDPSIPTATKEVRVGEIRVIGSGRRFVLIEISPRSDMPVLSPGVELRTRSPARDANGGVQTGTLRVSPERRQPFLVADVIAGEPRVEDPVFYSSENPLHLLPPEIMTPLLTPRLPPAAVRNEPANPHP
jgi:hypothetical protein